MWKQTVSDPLPFYVRIHSRKVLGIAGIITNYTEQRSRFRVLIRPANVLLQPLDKTMPCILEPDEYADWLEGNYRQILLDGFSKNLFMPDMTVFRVPDLVNNPANNSPELIQPIPKLKDEDE